MDVRPLSYDLLALAQLLSALPPDQRAELAQEVASLREAVTTSAAAWREDGHEERDGDDDDGEDADEELGAGEDE